MTAIKNYSNLVEFNQRRQSAAQPLMAARARRALLAIYRAPATDSFEFAIQCRYITILQTRVRNDGSLKDCGVKIGLGKDQYAGMLRRALQYAEAL